MTEKIFKIGLPILTAIILLLQLTNLEIPHGDLYGIIPLLMALIIWIIFFGVVLIVGIIVWLTSKKTYLLESFLYSALAFFAVVLLFNYTIAPKQMEEKEKNKELLFIEERNETKKLDSLNLILKNTPDDLTTLEERALFLLTINMEDEALLDMEVAVEQNTQNTEVYNSLARLYWKKRDFKKAESFAKLVLKRDSLGIIKLNHKDKNEFLEQLEEVKMY